MERHVAAFNEWAQENGTDAQRAEGGCAVSDLHIVPCTQQRAKEHIREYHRNLKPPLGSVFQVAVADHAGSICGVATVGRPSARHLDDGYTLEVTRCCTVGTPNACSMLYGATWRVARALGYARLLTYTLATEPGTSLRAAGWRPVGITEAREWSCRSRPRAPIQVPLVPRICWTPQGSVWKCAERRQENGRPLLPNTQREDTHWSSPVGWEDYHDAPPGVVYDRGGMPYCSQRRLDAARREGVECGEG